MDIVLSNDHLLSNILKFVTPADLNSTKQVNKQWKSISVNEAQFYRKYKEGYLSCDSCDSYDDSFTYHFLVQYLPNNKFDRIVFTTAPSFKRRVINLHNGSLKHQLANRITEYKFVKERNVSRFTSPMKILLSHLTKDFPDLKDLEEQKRNRIYKLKIENEFEPVPFDPIPKCQDQHLFQLLFQQVLIT